MPAHAEQHGPCALLPCRPLQSGALVFSHDGMPRPRGCNRCDIMFGANRFASCASCLPDLAGFGFHGHHRIARIDDALRPIGQFLVIDRLMMRRDDDGVKARNRFAVPRHRTRARPMRMLTGLGDDWHVRIIIGDIRTAFALIGPSARSSAIRGRRPRSGLYARPTISTQLPLTGLRNAFKASATCG